MLKYNRFIGNDNELTCRMCRDNGGYVPIASQVHPTTGL